VIGRCGPTGNIVSTTLRIGRIGGVDVGLHWSWLLVVALIVWSLSAGVFPTTNPGLGDGAYLAMAIVAALGFFASILLHELGHAVQARREGIPVDGITLWVFGGVARMTAQPPSAGAELRVALAGPAVSLVLGCVFLLAALAAPLPAAVDGTAFWLGQMNLYLLAFNLLPAFPLDGGRVVRAVLWARRRDFASATQTATTLGRAFGQLFIVGGLVLTIVAGAFGGLWLAFIGWFLLVAAEAERALVIADDSLRDLRVWQLMVPNPVTVPANASVADLIEDVFLPTRHTAFPVADGDKAAGIVSFRDGLELPWSEWAQTPVREVMEGADKACVDPAAPVAEVLPRLATGRHRRLLVCRDGRLFGLLSLTDVMRVLEARAAQPTDDAARGLDGHPPAAAVRRGRVMRARSGADR
jgi:Zn-dependent protease/CBS domain-containing protein